MRSSKLILFVGLFSQLITNGQIPTFERSYNDTFNLGCNASTPVELDSGQYFVASSGFGLSIPEGGVQRLISFDDQGMITKDNFNYDLNRRYFDFCSLKKSNDGNLLISNTRSRIGDTGGNQIFVQKITPDFSDTLWSFYYHDSLYFDTAADMLEMPNGDVVVISNRNILGDSFDIVFLRINEGTLLSETLINLDVVDIGRSIELLVDGNLLIGGARGVNSGPAELKGFLMKATPNGEVIWSRSYSQVYEGGASVYHENKYVFGGYKSGPKILFIDSVGGGGLNKSYSYPQSGSNYIAHKVSDGGIVGVGITTNAVESNAGYIMKTDAAGNVLWQKRYNHGENVDYFVDFIETKDGGLLVSGAAFDQIGGQNAWIVKLAADGCLDPSNCNPFTSTPMYSA
jgi:hypothetical protein